MCNVRGVCRVQSCSASVKALQALLTGRGAAHVLLPAVLIAPALQIRGMSYLFHSDVWVDGCGMEGDFDLGLLAGGQEARGWEGNKVRPQSSHIQCKLGAYVSVVLYLNPLRRLHHPHTFSWSARQGTGGLSLPQASDKQATISFRTSNVAVQGHHAHKCGWQTEGCR